MCNDEIDVALGYFSCAQCKEDYCKECAVDRDKPDYEIAENPYVLPTPIQDIMEDSWVGRQFIVTEDENNQGPTIKGTNRNFAEQNQLAAELEEYGLNE